MDTQHHADIPNRIKAKDVPHPGTWIAAVIVAVLVAMLAHGLVGEHIQRRDRRSLVHIHAQHTPAFRTAKHRRR